MNAAAPLIIDSTPTMERLRAHLQPVPAFDAIPRDHALAPKGDFQLNPGFTPFRPGPLKPAAVLVPVVAYEGGERVILTKRTAHLSNHAGQISFPGGRVDAEDPDVIATALRETEEEIGLDRVHISVLGALDAYGENAPRVHIIEGEGGLTPGGRVR